MAILVSDLISTVESALDAEGSGYYNFTRDYKPAINYALDWVNTVISGVLGTKKFPEEIFRELTFTQVWQTSSFSRVMIDPADIGREVWTIVAVMLKPDVTIVDNTDLLMTLPIVYYTDVIGYVGLQQNDKPQVSQAFNATGATLLKQNESTFRPELAYLNSVYICNRVTAEEWTRKDYDPFSAGYQAKCDMFTQPGYISWQNYTTSIGGYSLSIPREIEVAPALSRGLVAITYIGVPNSVTATTDIIPFPQVIYNAMVQKTLQYMSQKQQVGTNQYVISDRELLQVLGAID